MSSQKFLKIIKKHKNKNYALTLQTMINLADYYSSISLYKDALAQLEEAKRYCTEKLSDEHPKMIELQFEIDKGFLYLMEKEELPEPFNQFIEKYENAEMKITLKQNFGYAATNILIYMEKYDQAREYATKSMKILEQFSKKNDDYFVRKIQLYALLIQIAVNQKDKDETKKLLKLAFDCPKYEKDPNLHFFLLCCQRKHVSRDERKEISAKMFEIFDRFKNGRMKEEKLDAFYNLFEDYCFENNMIKAEEMLWKIHCDKECLKMDKKGFVKKNLFTLYKLPKCLEQIDRFKAGGDYEKGVLIYQKIANEFFETEEYENARDYYLKMKKAAENLPPEEPNNYRNFQHIKDALEFLILCLREYAVCQKDYAELLQYLQEQYLIQQKLGAQEDILKNLEIEEIFIKSLCDYYTFEERKDALLNVRKKLTTDIQMLNYYKYTIRLIKNNREEFGEAIQDIWILEEQYNIFKEKTKDFKDPATIIADSTFVDENDAITDDEILQLIGEKWKKFDRIESFKKKLNKIDIYGETELHRAISSDATDLNHIKFLIEECGYDEIIDKPDNAGITPLMNSIINDRNDIFEYLLEKGAKSDPPMGNTNGSSSVNSTPLMEAIIERNVDAIRLLLQHNANPLLKNKNGETAMDLLKEQLRTGHMFLTAKRTLYGPKHAKKEMPMSQETFDELQTVQKLLRKAEKKFAKNHPEILLQNENIGENVGPIISRKRRRESIDPINNL